MESLDEVESALHSHVRREEEVAAEEGRGVEYALSDLAECIRLLIGRVREDSSHADEAARLKALREAVHLNFGAAGGEYVLPSQQACCETERASLI
mmetsp:Transcript_23990/g.79722  ORF Transcript_23990/g.79722 Transcript_23990/m.79722 type:complete len:96 (+) Transcript_23990:980-1267(+)